MPGMRPGVAGRAAILRSARGWYLQHGDDELRAALQGLPPTITMRFGI
jgi:hypothetical protein